MPNFEIHNCNGEYNYLLPLPQGSDVKNGIFTVLADILCCYVSLFCLTTGTCYNNIKSKKGYCMSELASNKMQFDCNTNY